MSNLNCLQAGKLALRMTIDTNIDNLEMKIVFNVQ